MLEHLRIRARAFLWASMAASAFALPSPPTAPSPRAAAAPIAPSTQDPAPQRLPEREVWWNASWARILELGGGSWSVHAEPEFTEMIPSDDSCKVVVLARGTGEVFQYAMKPAGRVTLGFGWIMISPERPGLISALPSAAMVGFPAVSNFEGEYARAPRFERISWRGDEEWVVRRSERYRFVVSTPRPASEGGNSAVLYAVTGEDWDQPKRAGNKVVYMQRADPPGAAYDTDYTYLGGAREYY